MQGNIERSARTHSEGHVSSTFSSGYIQLIIQNCCPERELSECIIGAAEVEGIHSVVWLQMRKCFIFLQN